MNLRSIQDALRTEQLDGWLFFDHHQRDPLAYRILGLSLNSHTTRRWYYFIPARGEPVALVHRIEPHSLDGLPGSRRRYSRWTEQTSEIGCLLGGAKRIAMQFSPNCVVPYVSMVDGGTVDLIRGFGVEVVSSANLVQFFEARWSNEQFQSHMEAGRRMDRIRAAAFLFVKEKLRSGVAVHEFEVQQFLREQFRAHDLVTDHGPVVAVNANASDPHYEPNEERSAPICKGDLLLIDMWAKQTSADAVYYDITWTGYAGATVPDDIQNVFCTVRDARELAAEFVRKSVEQGREISGYQVDDVAREHITTAGFGEYFIHRTGHSIGQEVHGSGANMDNFETHDERRIIANTCFSIEPGVYLPSFGIRSEVNMFVGETAAQITGEAQRELVILL
jgi:Xaa-Pro aminopeptidase